MISSEERAKTIETIISASQRLDSLEKKLLEIINKFEDVKELLAKSFEKIGTDIPKTAKIYVVKNDMFKFKKLIAILKEAKQKVAVVIRNSKDHINCNEMLDDDLKKHFKQIFITSNLEDLVCDLPALIKIEEKIDGSKIERIR